jgi:serine/threonine protein kinase
MWSETIKKSKLARIKNNLLRNLISLLLSKDPKKRPTIASVLRHPFLTGIYIYIHIYM